MPPRKARRSPKKSPKKASAEPIKKPAVKKARAVAGVAVKGKKKAGPWKMPPPLPAGEVLTDICKKQWTLGTSVGKGGFGEIYLAAKYGSSASAEKAEYVIKIEPHENGPLFTELSFYTRIAKPSTIDSWIQSHELEYLPIPKYIASGSHEHQHTKYRFMVMPRYGEDVEKIFTSVGRKFNMDTVCYLALQLLEAVEFLHESEYVHADIKGANLLTGFGRSHSHEVYLVDYGLAYRFNPAGEHKTYKEDPRKAHDGTIEFTSIDAHKGVSPSRRGDMEILGYCLLQWACGRLPWEDDLENKNYVASMKMEYQSDVAGLMRDCFGSHGVPQCLKQFMTAVYKLDYTEKPNYNHLKSLFTRHLGGKNVSKSLEWLPSSRKRKSSDEADSGSPPKKPRRSPVKKKSPIGKKSPIRKRKPARKRAAVEPSVSGDMLPEVIYPTELGYCNDEGSKDSSEVIVVEDSSPPVKRKRRTRKR